MLRLDGLLRRRRRLVMGIWIVVLLAALPLAARQAEDLTGGGFEDPHAQSTKVSHAVAADFPDISDAGLSVVLVPRPGATLQDVRGAVADVRREATDVADVTIERGGLAGVRLQTKLHPHRPLLIPLRFSGGEQRAIDIATELREQLGIVGGDAGSAAGGRVAVHLVGQGAIWAAFEEQAKHDSTAAETFAFPVIALLLLLAFGSVAAMALPLGLGVAAVIVTGALIFLLSQLTTMSLYVTSMASLVGIGVAVDYSLFILARYREEVAGGRPPDHARAAALATSGLAVVFSGLTVITSLCAIFLIDSTAMRSIAAGAIIVVATSALAAATVLPGLISLLGNRTHEPGRLARALARRRERSGGPPAQPFWERWAEVVMRHAVVCAIAATAVLLLLAAPALDLHIANRALGQLPPEHEQHDAARAAKALLGPGALGPVLVHVDFRAGRVNAPANARALTRAQAAADRDRAVSFVVPPLPGRDGRSAVLTTVLRVDPESAAARAAVDRLRKELPNAAGPAATVAVGGTTAVLMDFDRLVERSLWKLIVFVLALSFVVLVVLLRSLVLPLKAVVMNVLSVAAAYGTLVAVFQWGWLEFLGLHQVPSIETISPPLILVITFGLSMDYEIFLLTRIRERYLRTGDNRRAVAEGLATSARTITSAALIMITVCIAFVASGLGALQRLGLATAVALAVDATIVRLVLVPAAMTLLGKWNWWLPAPLERLLPVAHVETLDVDLETAQRRPVEAGATR
ncbi:MAG TPA: MMPL family transporter [Conexibacter sp.]|nr:MMPL family transporter [Conexibacter sp.]